VCVVHAGAMKPAKNRGDSAGLAGGKPVTKHAGAASAAASGKPPKAKPTGAPAAAPRNAADSAPAPAAANGGASAAGATKARARTVSNASSVSAGGKSAKGAPVAAASSSAAAADAPAPAVKYSHSSARKPAEETLAMHTDDLESDDELPVNTVGNVPKAWYDGMDHVGYGLDGEKVARPVRRDGIDRFLAAQDDPHYRWTFWDEEAGEEVTLTKRDLQLLTRIHSGAAAHPEASMYVELTDIYSAEKELHPLNSDPYEPKRRFLPSKWEGQRINRIAKAIREGRMARAEAAAKRELPPVYLLWGEDGAALDHLPRSKAPPPIPAPKQALPGHAASYNPPSEYLLTPAEEAAWKEAHPSERPYGLDFIPRKYASLRHVPLYAPGARERFERLLDLYLCPRATRKREDADPEALLPKLPDPSRLKPFPSAVAVDFPGHTGRVRSLSFDPTGQYLATGSDDGTARVWEVATGRCLHSWALGGPVGCVAWCPHPDVQVVAAVTGSSLVLVYPGTCTPANAQATFDALTGARRSSSGGGDQGAAAAAGGKRGRAGEAAAAAGADDSGDDSDGAAAEKKAPALRTCVWRAAAGAPALASADDLLPPLPGDDCAAVTASGPVVTVEHTGTLRQVVWHRKGDYVATVAPQAGAGAVMIHQLTRAASQCPLASVKGQPQAVSFHPSKPLFYVANQRTVRVYHLTQQVLVSKLESGAKWISSLAVHPTGDHVLLGSYDGRVVWFDTELSSKPFRTLRYHAKGVRKAAFHAGGPPLMATASDDGSVHVFHARVFNDFTNNPLLVPVKILRGHAVTSEGLGVLDCAFHPTLPWLATAGADGGVKLWHNLP
jgi:ribosome biogenesis protein ERB1